MSLDKENYVSVYECLLYYFFIGFGLFEGMVEGNHFVHIRFWEEKVALVKNFKFLSERYHNSHGMKQN